MKRYIIHADIVTVEADALIYSTNVRLALTGGVGAALVREYGIGIQIALQDQSLGTGRQLADVGEVFTTWIAGAPWKRVFHAIATDEQYHTEAARVRAILRACFRRCEESNDLRTIVCSVLGAGYGDLDPCAFLLISNQVCDEFDYGAITSFAVVVHDPEEYALLVDASTRLRDWGKTA